MYVAPAGSRTHLIFDVTGYYMTGAGGAVYVPLSPVRVVDSRSGLGLPKPLANGSIKSFSMAGYLPAGTVAVSGNVTVTGQTSRGFVALARASPGQR